MSWLVQDLLSNTLKIKANPDIESDEFNNLIIVESRIKTMLELGVLTKREERLITLLSDGNTIDDINKIIKSNRMTIAKNLDKICEKIAYYLGGEFTDNGYLDYMQKKYKLNSEEIATLEKYMKSKFSKKLMRKPLNETKTI